MATAVVKTKAIRGRNLSDEEFSWCMTNFHVWPGEHCPALRRQADMGLAIRTTDDDLEEGRTAAEEATRCPTISMGVANRAKTTG